MRDHALAGDPYVAEYPELLPFWEAAGQGTLVLPRCLSCGQTHWHPRMHCPWCRSGRITWEKATGRGTLHTFTVIHRRDAPDDLLAYVALAEGPLMLTRIVDADAEALRIGMPVFVRFMPTPEGRHAPFFAPLAADPQAAAPPVR